MMTNVHRILYISYALSLATHASFHPTQYTNSLGSRSNVGVQELKRERKVRCYTTNLHTFSHKAIS